MTTGKEERRNQGFFFSGCSGSPSVLYVALKWTLTLDAGYNSLVGIYLPSKSIKPLWHWMNWPSDENVPCGVSGFLSAVWMPAESSSLNPDASVNVFVTVYLSEFFSLLYLFNSSSVFLSLTDSTFTVFTFKSCCLFLVSFTINWFFCFSLSL